MIPGNHFNPMVINVDHDHTPPQKLLESYILALQLGKVAVYESPRKRGYHFSISLDQPINVKQNYHLRGLLGDDKKRMDIELPYVNDFLYAVRIVDGKILARKRLSNSEFLRRVYDAGGCAE